MDALAILEAVNRVTKKWAKQRKAEERERSRAFRRREALTKCERLTIREVAFDGMEAAYLQASTERKYPAQARQIMYVARGPIQDSTGRSLDDQYFTQTLLPDYLTENPDTTKEWDVVFDARGHFAEPHTGLIVPLGTLDVRSYLRAVETHDRSGVDPQISLVSRLLMPTSGPQHRFAAVLFIEKEGFMPLFRAAKLAERYDIAIMSTKGMSVTASRRLVDRLCAEYEIPLIVLRDFDKSGFSIVGTLQRDTRRYSFEGDIQVIDLGLRLRDVEEWRLESEEVAYGKADPAPNLRENGASEEEIAFLRDQARSRWRHHVGRRVELNAFTSGDFLRFIETGLQKHGVKKVLPDQATLELAFRRAYANRIVENELEKVINLAKEAAARLNVPRSLEKQIRASLKAEPALSWDGVIAKLAAET